MIEFQNISKRFPGVQALSDVSVTIARGTCHALLGENGAGKSTLGKILAGLYQPESGQRLIDGVACRFRSPREATQAGVGIVHQELVFCPNLSVAENLCLHDLPSRWGRVDRAALRHRARGLLDQVGLAVHPDTPLARLSIAQEQLVQIAAAVGLGARVLVFDEPTSSLGQEETSRLFKLIRSLQEQGTTIVYVSHRLEELFALCQSVTVLRDGKHVGTRSIADVTRDELVKLMVGREVAQFVTTLPTQSKPVRLKVTGLSSPGRLRDVSLEVRAGEIVGLAGLVGAGRTEIAEALAGMDSLATGHVEVDGKTVALGRPRLSQRAGISLLPEDRKRQGLVLGMRIRENISLSVLNRFQGLLGRVSKKREAAFANTWREKLRIRTPTVEVLTHSLSGGNQQKVMFGKGLALNPKVLLIDEPTRGVDVGAKREIHELIEKLAAEGSAILVISSDLPELLALAHRVLVVREGTITASLSRDQADAERVLRAMAGIEATTRPVS